jgi:hypothetical protein
MLTSQSTGEHAVVIDASEGNAMGTPPNRDALIPDVNHFFTNPVD